jgi:hypothetical protein
MVRFAWSDWVLAAGLVTVSVVPSQIASGAVGDGETQRLAEAVVGMPRTLDGSADVQLRFVQEDGPESGHVRVLLIPESRSLNQMEARSAAEQAFLAALNEPGLGDKLSRITVVVQLIPATHPQASSDQQVYRFLFRGGSDWSILLGE